MTGSTPPGQIYTYQAADALYGLTWSVCCLFLSLCASVTTILLWCCGGSVCIEPVESHLERAFINTAVSDHYRSGESVRVPSSWLVAATAQPEPHTKTRPLLAIPSNRLLLQVREDHPFRFAVSSFIQSRENYIDVVKCAHRTGQHSFKL